MNGPEFSDLEQAQGELSLARVAIAEGDLKHAANHVAGAIAYAPALPEVRELLATLAARSEDGGLGLFPVEADAYLGTVVAPAPSSTPTCSTTSGSGPCRHSPASVCCTAASCGTRRTARAGRVRY